jgi:hypothetical protein
MYEENNCIELSWSLIIENGLKIVYHRTPMKFPIAVRQSAKLNHVRSRRPGDRMSLKAASVAINSNDPPIDSTDVMTVSQK